MAWPMYRRRLKAAEMTIGADRASSDDGYGGDGDQ